MPSGQNTSFRYKVFKSGKKPTKELLGFINLYAQNTHPHIRTSVEELIDDFQFSTGDKVLFYICSYENRSKQGFLVATHYPVLDLCIIDECAMERELRSLPAFTALTDFAIHYLVEKAGVSDFVVEVAATSKHSVGEVSGLALARLVKMIGFKVLVADYEMPHVSMMNSIDRKSDFLMFRGPDEHDFIDRSRLVQIVHHLYFEHYMKWVERYEKQDTVAAYRRYIEETFRKFESSLPEGLLIPLDGEEVLRRPSNIAHARGDVPAERRSPLPMILMVFIPSAVTVVLAIEASLILTLPVLGLAAVMYLLSRFFPSFRDRLLRLFD